MKEQSELCGDLWSQGRVKLISLMLSISPWFIIGRKRNTWNVFSLTLSTMDFEAAFTKTQSGLYPIYLTRLIKPHTVVCYGVVLELPSGQTQSILPPEIRRK